MKPALVLILGPTATGKSFLAEHLAASLDGEIVGADSMQVYRGMDAGTAKPSAASRRRVPHHLVDVADPHRDFNLGDFVRAADEAIAGIRRRGRVPVVAGGTGMYLRGLLKGIDPAPPRDPRTRERLTALAERRGDPHLHHLLEGLDPVAAADVGRSDRMRLVRALERVLLTGRPSSRDRWSSPDRYAAVKVGLRMPSEALRRRIDARVDEMFAAGLVDETAGLLEAGVNPAGSAMKALGYRQVVEHLSGERDLEGTIAAVKLHTWRFSRRQMTWFRAEPGIRWFDVPGEGPETLYPLVRDYVMLFFPTSTAGEDS